jgi:hemolysin activation/secretion protein
MKFGRFIMSSAIPVMLGAPVALAQTAMPSLPYNLGNAVQQADEARKSAPPPVTGVPVLPELHEPLFAMKDKSTLFVRAFEVTGPEIVDPAAVHAILEPYENRKLTLAEIYEAADKVTAFYREQGYIFAKAYVPAQDARHGLLRIKLVPGQYGAITLHNESLVRDEFLHEVIVHALPGSPSLEPGSPFIQRDGLERAMLLVTDLPGAGVPRVVTGPGAQPETTDFLFNVPEGRRVDGYLLGDNYGPGFTGRDRLSAGIGLNSPLGYGDRLSGYGIVSNETHLVNGRVAYAFPIGYDGIRGEIAGFRTTYVLGGSFAGLNANGVADGGSGTLTYAIKRTREDSIYVSANFTHKFLDDKAFGTSFANRTIDLVTAAISRDTVGVVPFAGLPLTTSTSLAFTAGHVNFPIGAQQIANLLGADTQGNYERINLTFNAIVAFNQQWSLSTTLRAQKSLSGNLDSSEQLTLTGSWGIRSYDEGLSGDSGYVVTPELKYALPDIYGVHHSVGLFTDVGAVWLENGSFTTTQRSFTQLNDFGLGYYATYEYSPGRFLLAKGMVAHTYGEENGAGLYDRKTKGLVQVGFTF